MPLSIKDDAVAELARELARRRGCTVTEVVRAALEQEQRRERTDRAAHAARLKALQARFRQKWQGGGSEHGFLYEENGNRPWQ
jgi:hypothetical protein